jgi:SagB-type dehydrogenase family enzyme
MDRRELLKMAAAMSLAGTAAGADTVLELPAAQLDGGMPLMTALKHRRSAREFSTRKLPLQALSNLLWAAFGVNRPGTGGRTAPSAHGWQEIEVYAAMENGLFRYNYKSHALKPVNPADLRRQTGLQDFAGSAPLDLVYVADFARMEGASMEDKTMYSAADAGFISQNVYLCCAQEGLATVVRGLVDRAVLGKAMDLKPDQRIILAQTVGYPAA